MDDDLHDLFGHDPSRRASDDEAAARLAIERAFSALRGADARARVLRWAIERFGVDSAPAPRDHASSQADAPDLAKPQAPAVSVDDLTDLFDAPDEPGQLRAKPGTHR